MEKQEWKNFLLLSIPLALALFFGFGLYFLLGKFFTPDHQFYCLAIGFCVIFYAIFKLGMQKRTHYLTLWLGTILTLYSGMVVYPNSDILIFRDKQSTLTDHWFILWPTDVFSHKLKMIAVYQTCLIDLSVIDSTGQKIATGHAYAKFKVDTDNPQFQTLISDTTNSSVIMELNLRTWLNKFSKAITDNQEIGKWLKTKEGILSVENYSLATQSTKKIINVELNQGTKPWEELTSLSLNPKQGYVQLTLNQ